MKLAVVVVEEEIHDLVMVKVQRVTPIAARAEDHVGLGVNDLCLAGGRSGQQAYSRRTCPQGVHVETMVD